MKALPAKTAARNSSRPERTAQSVSQRTWTGSRCRRRARWRHSPPPITRPLGFEGDPPYTMGVVDFGDGLKLFARLAKEIKPEDVKVGMAVTTRPLKYDDGQISFEIVKA